MYIPMNVTIHDQSIEGKDRIPPQVTTFNVDSVGEFHRLSIQGTVDIFYSLEGIEELSHVLTEWLEARDKDEESLPGFPKLRYDSGRDEFILAKNEFYVHNEIIPMAEISKAHSIPVALADYAHRHPEEWVTIQDVERRRK